MSRDGQAQSSVKVLSKAVAVLDVLARERELTPAELAERLDEPRSTLYRVIAALEEHDLVQPGGRRGSFQLGLRLFTLGSAVARRFDDVRAAALPAMERLHERTGQTVFLTVRRGFEALCVERLDGDLVGVMILPVGGTVPLHGGANARALLAFEPPELWEEYLDAGPLERFTPSTETTRAGLTGQLRKIRDDGYSISDQDVIPGIASIGAPVFDHEQRVRASISLSGPQVMVLGDHADENVALVRDAAAAISRQLGQQDVGR
ncbi:IclR family transcriptional regulator [Conexibacter arvalis]|uniref:DNA-binding IclR family transcriptional regulator n=1 Tax=Conexibacter arvalis TaxID=912552 RepID=A0A840I847_9ACTN|nr:IclR family transcriptional regulator [Conexibacter arvalis]MBB4660451.1 DNA-binding IclR family transcriptional regulator [Conexibacter arvalis]